MKDALGHGSNAHSGGIEKIGKIKVHPQATATAVYNLLHSGGFSVKPETGASPKSGYMVSIPGHTKIIAGDPDERAIQQYANEHAGVLQHPGAHIGGWQHEGNTYLDVSHRYSSKSKAAAAGKQHNQIAIWDVKHGREINTGGTGE
jgi:hypothetical protein